MRGDNNNIRALSGIERFKKERQNLQGSVRAPPVRGLTINLSCGFALCFESLLMSFFGIEISNGDHHRFVQRLEPKG